MANLRSPGPCFLKLRVNFTELQECFFQLFVFRESTLSLRQVYRMNIVRTLRPQCLTILPSGQTASCFNLCAKTKRYDIVVNSNQNQKKLIFVICL